MEPSYLQIRCTNIGAVNQLNSLSAPYSFRRGDTDIYSENGGYGVANVDKRTWTDLGNNN